MKVYQLVFGHHSYEEGYFTTPGRIYVHKADAEAAKAWMDSIPDDPCSLDTTEVSIQEVEIEDTFVPWISEEKIEAMRKEVHDYYERMERGFGNDWSILEEEGWGGDEYD